MICSIVIPTRGRPERLIQTIQSVRQSAGGGDFEFMLGVDSDDRKTLDHPELKNMIVDGNDIQLVVGPRPEHYNMLYILITKLADMAKGRWIWILNDDCIVSGEAWDFKLLEIPTFGFIVQPEFYKLNESEYRHVQGGNFPLVPNGCWRDYDVEQIPEPADVQIDQLLRVKHGWETAYLEGITAFHDRRADETLPASRL